MRITVDIPDKMIKRVDQKGSNTNRTRSGQLRQIIQEWIEQETEKEVARSRN